MHGSENAVATAQKAALRATVKQSAPALLALSHDLHANPEIRWQEHRSVREITALLARHGFAVDVPFGGLATAFRARLGSGTKHVAFIAEYDALEGLGHACGHNIIAASSVGAAIALASLVEELDVTVDVIGAPAEEGGGGKIHLLEAGVLDHLDIAMMIHPGPGDALWARPFAVAHFDVAYEGHAAHAAAYPHLGVNAADAMTIAQVAIGLLRQQLPHSVRVHGITREAGVAPNSIPQTARGSWYVRAADLEQLETMFAKVLRCFQAGALATGCELTVEETSPRYSQFRNDEELAGFFAANARVIGRDMDADELDPAGMNTASTDMGNVSLAVRAIHPYLSIGSLPAVNHQREFADAAASADADRATLDGAYLLAATAADYLRGWGR